MAFYGREVANPPGGVHLPHETITDLRRQTGSVLVLPIFKWTRVGNLEAVEERTVNAHVPSGQMRRVDVDPALGQTHSRALQKHRRASDFRFDDGQPLREGMIGVSGRGARPQEIGQIVAGESFVGFQRETNQQCQMLARTKPDLLAGNSEQGGTTQAAQHEGVTHIHTRFIDSFQD